MNKKMLSLGLVGLMASGTVAQAAEGMITIDAGHGGNNSTAGKRAANGAFYEWDINDKVADALEQMLEEKGYTVERLDDVSGQSDVSLNARLRKAKDLGSDLHISIHQNALDDIMWSNATGTETYYSVLGSRRSQELAKDIATRMAQYIGTVNRGDKGTTNELFITREFTRSGIDAVLVEGLFQDNEKDVEYMQTEEYVQSYAKAVFDGIVNTYGENLGEKQVQAQAKTEVHIIKTSIKAGDFVRVKEIGETLNIRRYPSPQSEIVGEINPGESFTVVDITEDGRWGLLKAYEENRSGWIKLSDKFVEVLK